MEQKNAKDASLVINLTNLTSQLRGNQKGKNLNIPTATTYQAGQHTNITTSSRAEHPVYLAQEPKQVKQIVAAASNQRWPFASRNS